MKEKCEVRCSPCRLQQICYAEEHDRRVRSKDVSEVTHKISNKVKGTDTLALVLTYLLHHV